MLSLTLGLLSALVGVWWVYDNKLMIERARVKELESYITKIYGSTDNVSRSNDYSGKRLERIIEDQREFKVAKECADKGIPRSNKVYPSRFKGW